MNHPAFEQDRVAVITGAADGIGLAAARTFSSRGMRVCMADINADQLAEAAASVPGALAIPTDVASAEQLQALRDQVYDRWQRVDVLMNNAGIGLATSCWQQPDNWQSTLRVNLGGVINGVQAFTAAMIEQQTPGLIINTGSKQGITSPPGNPAYNVSKAGIRVFTESLQHELRNTQNCQLSAHLLVPGFTFTGMIRKFIAEQPPTAWSPQQVIDFMMESVARGDFYVLCPDNDVDRDTDNKRMQWTMGDLIHNRPPLSRWHPDFAQEFAEFMGE